MDDNKVAFRHLARRVAGETVTFRLLSRELGITVTAAKLVFEAYLAEPSTAQKNVGATYALTGTLKEADVDAGDMDVDTDSDVAIPRRTTLLVQAADLQDKLSLFASPPAQFVYALSPGPLPSLDILAAFSLSTIDPIAVAKWKPAPTEGYGTIVHPEGERRKKADKKGKGKAVVAPKVVPSTTGSKPSMFGTTKDKDAGAKDKAKPAVRKIGERGGLFARSEPVVVPKKRKASPPPPVKKVPEKAKKVVSNGIFGDEEIEDEEDDEEEAMREMEEEIARENKAKLAHPGETKAQREKRELQEMMDEDDDEIVAVSTKKSPPKKVVKPAPKAQGKLSFGGK